MSIAIPRHPSLLLATLLLAGLLTGCTGAPLPGMSDLPDRVELNGVPYFRGKANHSGAMALAALLRQQGVEITPGLLDKPLQLPEQVDQLQTSLARVAREYGMLVYPLEGNLRAVLTQVAAGYPVLVRYTEGTAFWAEPRYALLVGYDRFKDSVLLRAADERRLPMSFSTFQGKWQDAGGWAVLIQRPSQLPAEVDRQRWLAAAHALAKAGQESEAARAVKTLGSR